MAIRSWVDRWAKASLFFAGGLVLLGLTGSRLFPEWQFWGYLLAAFGEASLVGGLADWFAVRALFERPLGIPFHTALIPRNRERIVLSIRQMVQEEWLTVAMLQDRINRFDFVETGTSWASQAGEKEIHGLLRTLGKRVVRDLDPATVAGYLARAATSSFDITKLEPMLAPLVKRARREGWLDLLLKDLLNRLEAWTNREVSYNRIYGHLRHMTDEYGSQSWFKKFSVRTAEVFGGIDLHAAARLIQAEISTFARTQLFGDSDLHQLIDEALDKFEQRLVEDPNFQAKVRQFLEELPTDKALEAILIKPLQSLKNQVLTDLDAPDSKVVEWAMAQVRGWSERFGDNQEARTQANTWLRNLLNALIAKHHSLIGSMVEDQLNRLSNEKLVEMIEEKAGDDLNFIRINGAVVGGIVGVLLFLARTALLGP